MFTEFLTIGLCVHQRIQEEKRVRDTEIKRRETERKLRHEKLARDGKKSFFELEQSAAQGAQTEDKTINEKKGNTHTTEPHDKNNVEKSPQKLTTEEEGEGEGEEVPTESLYGKNESDLNALDYEADKDDNVDEPEAVVTVQRVEIEHKSVRDGEKSSKTNKRGENEKSSKKESDSKKSERRHRSRSKEKRSRSKEKRSRSRDRDRGQGSRNRNDRNDRRLYRRVDFSLQRDNRRREAHRFKRNRSRSPSFDRSRRQRHRDSR